ncbi:hypothetical protein DYB28_004833 [Aphanomyces astaci]|uniref:Uncharacterized protein n=1 Tax=Aphanomyces astaci TaxID=112090 RepID=A0A9X8DY18_APHAT|nr:hypothetical protein DYB28_004833 [Aphanomyces astaci]
MTAALPVASEMGNRKSIKKRRRGKKGAQVADVHKVATATKEAGLSKPPTNQSHHNADATWTVYLILTAAAAVGAWFDLVTRVVADDYTSRWCKFLFVILVCINVRTHVQLGAKPWTIRAVMYIACNFAGATTICIARAEVPAYLRNAQPWINVMTAGALVEGLLFDGASRRVRSMWLRVLCVVPVSLWKTKTLGKLIHDCYVTSVPLHQTMPMVTADMAASGIMMLFLSYVDLYGATALPKLTQLQRLKDIALHVVVVGFIALVWKTEEAAPWLHPHAAPVAGGLVLLYNLVKFCWLPLEFALVPSPKQM